MESVSVIVCTYNQQDTIRRCLDSIVSQKCASAFEVIIGEDGGTDNTRSICEEYVRKFPDLVRLMPQAPNKGVVQNYYDCIRAAHGEYIMECAGDDEWCQGRIELCLGFMQKHTEVVQLYTDLYYREEESGVVTECHSCPFPYGLTKGRDVIDRMFHQRHDQIAAYAITRRSAIMQVMERFPEFFGGRKYMAEDKQLVILLGTVGDVYRIKDCTFYYTTNAASITHSANYAKMYQYNKNMLTITHDLAEAVHYESTRLSDTYADICYCLLTRVFLSGDKTLLQDYQTLVAEFTVTDLSFKNTMLLMAMRNSLVWKTARWLFGKLQ